CRHLLSSCGQKRRLIIRLSLGRRVQTGAPAERGKVLMKTQTTTTTGVERVQALDWEQIGRSLSSAGNAVLSQLLSAEECQQLAALYPQNEPFRSHILMGRHGFGRGEYKHFACPLPTVIADLRSALYARFVPIANSWEAGLSSNIRYPDEQTRAEVVPLQQGDAVAFAVPTRPVQGTRGTYRANMRHGVIQVRSGQRHTVGIIFHDAQ